MSGFLFTFKPRGREKMTSDREIAAATDEIYNKERLHINFEQYDRTFFKPLQPLKV
jgi:hypothetical protein